MTPQEKERLRLWGKGLSGDIEIRFLGTEDTRSQALSKSCADPARFASKVRVLQTVDLSIRYMLFSHKIQSSPYYQGG